MISVNTIKEAARCKKTNNKHTHTYIGYTVKQAWLAHILCHLNDDWQVIYIVPLPVRQERVTQDCFEN